MRYTGSAVITCGVPCDAARRGVRGGSWNNNQDNARAVYRNRNNPNNRNNNIGFRVCRPTPLFPFRWRRRFAGANATGFIIGSSFQNSRAIYGFPAEAEGVEKAQGDPVRTNTLVASVVCRAHTKPTAGVQPVCGLCHLQPATEQTPNFRHHHADVAVLPVVEPTPMMRQAQIEP